MAAKLLGAHANLLERTRVSDRCFARTWCADLFSFSSPPLLDPSLGYPQPATAAGHMNAYDFPSSSLDEPTRAGASMWFFIFYRARQDGPVLLVRLARPHLFERLFADCVVSLVLVGALIHRDGGILGSTRRTKSGGHSLEEEQVAACMAGRQWTVSFCLST